MPFVNRGTKIAAHVCLGSTRGYTAISQQLLLHAQFHYYTVTDYERYSIRGY